MSYSPVSDIISSLTKITAMGFFPDANLAMFPQSLVLAAAHPLDLYYLKLTPAESFWSSLIMN